MEDTETVEQEQPRKEELTPAQALQVTIDSLNEDANQRITSLLGFTELFTSDDPRYADKKETAAEKIRQESRAIGKTFHMIVVGLQNVKEKQPTWVKNLPNGVTVFTANPDPLVK